MSYLDSLEGVTKLIIYSVSIKVGDSMKIFY